MARYIDADKALEFIKKTNANYNWLVNQYNAFCIYDFIESQPTADVVPKSEVEKLEQEIETLKDNNEHLAVMLMEAKNDVARNIFEEIDRYVIRGISVNGDHLTLFNGKNYAELKKKYIGDTDGK